MKSFVAPLAVSVAVCAAPLAARAQGASYTIDPFHSFVHFEVDHLGGLTRIRGRFDKLAGKLNVDLPGKTGAAEVVVQTASITTGDNDKGSRPRSRDEHLRSPDFFNVAEFPTMTFKSNKIVFTGDAPSAVEGTVTLLGVTKPIMLKVDRFRCMQNPTNKRDMCGFNASGSIKRSDFGMKFGIPSIGDEQALFIGVEAYKD